MWNSLEIKHMRFFGFKWNKGLPLSAKGKPLVFFKGKPLRSEGLPYF